jgi:hypothetical protein
LFEVLKSQGMQLNQQVTFLTDGGEDVRELPLYLNPQAEHVLDWFHLTMRLTVMGQYAKSLPTASTNSTPSTTITDATADAEDGEPEEPLVVVTRGEAEHQLERLKWFLWHGNVYRALQVVQELEIDLDVEQASPGQRKLLQAVTEFGGYVRANGAWIPNYGERYRAGEAISSAFARSPSPPSTRWSASGW